MNLSKLFNPKTIAIVGASEEKGKVGNVIAKNILDLGYLGEVFLVNPKYDNLFGKKCHKKLSEIEKEIDLAIIAIPAKFVAFEIRENADKIKNYVVISAGFSEMNGEGKAREKELAELAKEKNLAILGPNCLGFISPNLKLNASFAGGMPEAGDVAFVSQSGALAVAIMDMAKKENMKFSNIVSIGNKMNVSETEMLEYLAEDQNTKVIGMYLEGIKNGAEFMRVASAGAKIKPVIVLKAGKTEKAQKAISSHTGALAGSDEIMDAAFEKCGVLRASNLEEFFELINFISASGIVEKNKVSVITNAGGPGVLTTDAFKNKKITLTEINDDTKKKMRKFLPEESSIENPIDLLGDAKQDRYKKALDLLDKDLELGAIVAILTPQDQTPVAKIASTLIKFKNKSDKIIATSFIGGERVEKSIKKLKSSGIYNFSFPERSVEIMDAIYNWSSNRHNATEYAEKINSDRKEKVLAIIDFAKSEGRKALYFSEAKEIMEMYGVNASMCVNVDAPGSKSQDPGLLEPGAIGVDFPVVLKVDSDKVLHKTDKKALILNIQNQEELEKAITELRVNFPSERLIMQPMLEKGMELILGIKKDPTFGAVIVYGLGGIYTEVFKMVNFLLLPLTQEEIEKSLLESKLKFLFEETRGQLAYNLAEVAKIIEGISVFAQEITEFSEFDINPLMIYNDGKTTSAVDIKIIF